MADPRAYPDLFPHYFSRPPLSGLSFARQLCCDELDGVELRNGGLHIAPVKATTPPPEAEALADAIDAMLPGVRITEMLHEVSRKTGFSAAFTNLRFDECSAAISMRPHCLA